MKLPPETVLVTGGAGFVGSTLALEFRRAWPDCRVVAMDNLHRAGSELIVPRLAEGGVEFLHGDVRSTADFPEGGFDLLVECSAEPSVLAGYGTSPAYLVQTNLVGLLNCLEFCRERASGMVFLSTSRVYPVELLAGLPIEARGLRFEIADCRIGGVGPEGVSERCPLEGHRSLYGATKLAGELMVEEYRVAYGMPAVVNRCGVLAGPWQMGKGDQGVFTYWLLSHLFGRPLRYIGFGGEGRQVRDLLHAEDLAELVVEQAGNLPDWSGGVFNVGGGRGISLSLAEATGLCRELTGVTVEVAAQPEGRPMDIPVYLSDCRKLHERTAWRPRRDARGILEDTLAWAVERRDALQRIIR